MSTRSEGHAGFHPRAILLPRRSVWTLAVVLWVVAVLAGLAWYLVDSRGVFFLVGAVACLLVTLPVLLMQQYDLVSPWSLIIAVSYLAFGIRGFFISADIEGTRTLQELYFLGQPPEYFLRPSGIFLLGIIALTIGFLTSPRMRHRSRRLDVPRRFANAGTVMVVVGICALVGLAAFVMYAKATGGFSLANISSKRTLLGGTHASDSYQSHGAWRYLTDLSAVAFWVQVAHFSAAKVKHHLGTLRGWWLVALFLNATALPVYASTRQDVVMIAAAALAIKVCLTGSGVSKRLVIVSMLVVVAIVTGLSSLRAANTGSLSAANVSGKAFVDTFVLTRTFSDVPTTSHIIRAVPEKIDFADGQTLTEWALAPIPRSLWPDKPVISLGPEIAAKVYGNPMTGVPPGVIAEGYVNFGVPGVLGLSFLSGWIAGWLGRRWSWTARSSPTAAILLSAVGLRFGADLCSNGLGYAVFQVVLGLVTLVPILALVTYRAPQQVAVGPRGRRLAARA